MTITRREFIKRSAGAAAGGFVLLSGGPTSASAAPLHNPKGVRINMLPNGLSLEAGFRLARQCGFTQMEPFATFDTQLVRQTKAAADAAGIHIGSVANPMNWKYPLSSGDSAVAAEGVKAQSAAIENAHAWGADAILMIPGVVKPDVSYEEAWVRSRKQIEALLPLAEKLGVVIALEEVCDQSKFLLSPRDYKQYLDSFNSRSVRAYFDTGNVMPVGYPQDWIHELGHRIVKVHVKDWDPKTRKFVKPGDGAVDWPAVRQAFIDVGYKGTFTAELHRGDAAYLKDISARLDRLLLS